ncbi:MAG: AraC family ligand binding domain-containing protein [Dehalococcoidia bacterium]
MPETTRVPTGDYPKPASAHEVDLETEADRLLEALPGHRRQTKSLAREAGVSVIMMALEAGDAIQEHSADGVVMVHGLRGHVTLRSNGESLNLRRGQLAVFQPGVAHDLSAQEQSVVLLTVTGGDQ